MDRNSARRLGDQVYDTLRERIDDGQWRAGQMLPTELQLAAEFEVSRQTIRGGIGRLAEEGLVSRVRGKGTFVRSVPTRYVKQVGSVADLIHLAEDSVLRVIEPLRRVHNVVAGERLANDEQDVYTIEFVRLHDGLVFCRTEVFLPILVGERLREEAPELCTDGSMSSTTILGSVDAIAPVRMAEQAVSVEMVLPRVAELLGMEDEGRVLRIDRKYYGEDHRVVELAVSHFHPDRYSYRISLER